MQFVSTRYTTVITAALFALSLLATLASAAAWAQEGLAAGRAAIVHGTDGEGLRLRSGPGLDYAVQGTLPEGTRVQVLEGPQVADGHQWFRVSSALGNGWAAARYLVAEERVTLTASSASAGQTLQMRIVGYHVPSSAAPRTATGTTPRWGTVAVDPQVIPLGSRLMIEGFEGMIFVAEDTGGAVRGNIIDVWFDDPEAARRFGTQTRTVTVLGR
jgi:3D (Asp-Asp-Asp) domain-containing protein